MFKMTLSLKLLICLLFIACEPYTSKLTAAETTAAEPSISNPTAAETTAPEPPTSNPTAAETTAPEPPTSKPTAAETTAPEPPTSKPTVSEPPTPNPSAAETTAPEPTTENNTTAGPPATNSPRPEPTVKPGNCDSNPCKDGSTCEERSGGFICLCPTGEFYNKMSKVCETVKTVPGELTYTNITYDEKMKNKASTEFKTAADTIVEALKKVFGTDPSKKYKESIVIKLSPVATLTRATGVNAFVDIIFDKESTITPDEVKNEITTSGASEGLTGFTECGCDQKTSNCKPTETRPKPFSCSCKDAFVTTDFSDLMCVACPGGYKASKGVCVACNFGFSGVNCEERWQMDLVIVGSVLGALLLISVILLPVVAVTSKKKTKKPKKDKSTDYASSKPSPNHAPAKIPQVSNGLPAPRPAPVQSSAASSMAGLGGNGVPRIPRATTNESWDRNTNLEMVPSNSRQNLIPARQNSRRFDDHNDMNSNPYSRPMRPQNNPYAMGRPQVNNPYTSGQGHRNPYYSHDDGKRY